eukprot:c28192_g2_i1 orf=766-2931(+)
MSHCVPQWDAIEEELDVAFDSGDLFSPSKGKCEPVQPRRWNFSPTTVESDCDFEELCWDNGQLLVVKQSQNKEEKQRSLPLNSSVFSKIPSRDSGLTRVGLWKHEKDGTLEAVVRDLGRVTNSSSSNDFMQEEELVSWVQRQMDEPLYKCCSELASDVFSRNADVGQDRGDLKAVEPGQNSGSIVTGSLTRARNLGHASNAVVSGTGGCNSLSTSSDLTARVGPSRVPDLVTERGTRANLKMAASPTESPGIFKKANMVYTAGSPSGWSTSSIASYNKEMTVSPMPSPKPHSGDASPHTVPRKTTVMNFSHFSRPAAAFKANLRTIGVSDRPSGADGWKRLNRSVIESSPPIESSIQSAAMRMDSLVSKRDEMTLFNSTCGSYTNPCITSGPRPVQGLVYNKKKGKEFRSDNDAVNGSEKAVEQRSRGDCCLASDALRSEKGAELRDVPESTVTSSGGSGNNARKCEKVDNSSDKRKAQDIECSESQNGDPEEEAADVRKLRPSRSASAKRSRAAEIHNQSERRRRDRINERLRALQELIPNSNKTDKASLLEDAIEYLKMLQTQLQIMSFRTGVNVSPMFMPPGMQHFQIPQMASVPHMAMGMGMVDINAATAARHGLPWESLPVSAIPVCAVSALPVPAGATIPGSILATIAGSTLPATVIPMSPLPVSSLSGIHISMPSPHVIFPSPTVSIANHHNPWTKNDFNFITNQPLQITSQVC